MPPTRLRDASSVAQRLVTAVAAGYGLAVLSGFDLTAAACGFGLGAIAWAIGKRH